MELEVRIPDVLKGDRARLERRVQEIVEFEAKRKMLLEFVDSVMEGAKQLNDEELVKLSRKIKKGRFEQLKKRGSV